MILAAFRDHPRRPLPSTTCPNCHTTEASCDEKHARQDLRCCGDCNHEPEVDDAA